MGGGPGHSCPRGNTMKQSKGKKQPVVKPLKGRRVWEIGAALLLLAVLVVTAAALRGGEGEREARAARKRLFAVARVTDVLADHSAEDTWTEGRRLGEQYIEVKLLTGPFKGTVLETSNYLNAYTNVDCRLGTRIVVRLDYDDHGKPYIISVPNYDRGLVLAGLLVVFVETDCSLISHTYFQMDCRNLPLCCKADQALHQKSANSFFLSVPAHSHIGNISLIQNHKKTAVTQNLFFLFHHQKHGIIPGQKSKKTFFCPWHMKKILLNLHYLIQVIHKHFPQDHIFVPAGFCSFSLSARSRSAWETRRYSGICSIAVSVRPSL